jgi:ribulose 1,5-bisphosphate synthetase/thiazole synthase
MHRRVPFSRPRQRRDKETIMTLTRARHRVVIVGSGFGGLFAAKSLAHAPD